jgi:hypothetical protein
LDPQLGHGGFRVLAEFARLDLQVQGLGEGKITESGEDFASVVSPAIPSHLSLFSFPLRFCVSQKRGLFCL